MIKTNEKTDQQLVVSEETRLAINAVGAGLGINPLTIQKNLVKYLPNPLAQKFYFGLAVDYKLNVRDCAKMLTLLAEPQKLHPDDDVWVTVGDNLNANKANTILGDLTLALELNGSSTRFDGAEINKPTAVALTLLFGDSAETVIADLYGYLNDIKELFFMPGGAIDQSALRQAILAVVHSAWDDLDRGAEVSFCGTDYVERIRDMDFPERKEMYQNITWEDLQERYDVELP